MNRSYSSVTGRKHLVNCHSPSLDRVTSSGAEGSTYVTMAGVRAAKSATACGSVTCVPLRLGSGAAYVPGCLPCVRFRRGRWTFLASMHALPCRGDTDIAAVRPLFKLVRRRGLVDWPTTQKVSCCSAGVVRGPEGMPPDACTRTPVLVDPLHSGDCGCTDSPLAAPPVVPCP